MAGKNIQYKYAKLNSYMGSTNDLSMPRLQVKVTMREDNSKEEKFIRTLNKGDFFGEKALQG